MHFPFSSNNILLRKECLSLVHKAFVMQLNKKRCSNFFFDALAFSINIVVYMVIPKILRTSQIYSTCISSTFHITINLLSEFGIRP